MSKLCRNVYINNKYAFCTYLLLRERKICLTIAEIGPVFRFDEILETLFSRKEGDGRSTAGKQVDRLCYDGKPLNDMEANEHKETQNLLHLFCVSTLKTLFITKADDNEIKAGEASWSTVLNITTTGKLIFIYR